MVFVFTYRGIEERLPKIKWHEKSITEARRNINVNDLPPDLQVETQYLIMIYCDLLNEMAFSPILMMKYTCYSHVDLSLSTKAKLLQMQ